MFKKLINRANIFQLVIGEALLRGAFFPPNRMKPENGRAGGYFTTAQPLIQGRVSLEPFPPPGRAKAERASGHLRILAALPLEFNPAARSVTKFITFQKVRSPRTIWRHGEKIAAKTPRAMLNYKP